MFETDRLIAKRKDGATSTEACTVLKPAKDNGKVQVQPALSVRLCPPPVLQDGSIRQALRSVLLKRGSFFGLGSFARNFLASPSSFDYNFSPLRIFCVTLLSS